MYHDCNTLPWKIDKRWEDLTPKEWIEVCPNSFEDIGYLFAVADADKE